MHYLLISDRLAFNSAAECFCIYYQNKVMRIPITRGSVFPLIKTACGIIDGGGEYRTVALTSGREK